MSRPRTKTNITPTYRKWAAISYAKRAIANDHSREEIIEHLVDTWGYKEHTAEQIYCRGVELLEKYFCADADKIYMKNLKRLEGIIDTTMENEDSANALKAIDLQNKLSGLYIEKKEVKVESDTFEIKLGE